MKKAVFIIILAPASLCVLIFFSYFSFIDNKLHIVVCNVGQGDAIFITTPSQAQILIDGGPDKSVLDCLGRHMPFWDRSLDAVILTHPHADHLTGLLDIVDRYNLSTYYSANTPADSKVYELLRAKLADKKVSAKELHKGRRIADMSGLTLRILYPSLEVSRKADLNKSNLDLNSLSIVSFITYGNFSALLTGDAEGKILDDLSSEAGDIDFLKVPHHGSKAGMSDYLLNSTKPELAIISVGKKNRYGHPSGLSLDLLKKHKVKILRTDVDGEVEIVSDGKSYFVKTK